MNYLKKYKNLLIIVTIIFLVMSVFIAKKITSNKENKSGNESKNNNLYEYTFYNFTLDGCVACGKMDDLYNTIKQKYSEKINFEIIKVDKEYILANKYNVNLVPTFIITNKSGNVIKRSVGEISYEELEQMVESVIKR